MTELTLDKTTHTYSLGPGVTTILKRVGFISDRWFTEQAAVRGSYVHQACQYLEEKTLDDATVDDELRGYLNAYQKFLNESGWVSTTIEKPMHHAVLGYCGCPDRIGHMADGKEGILDLKSGLPFGWHKLQTAAYTALYKPDDPQSIQRYSLYLRGDGSYKLDRYADKNDLKIFLATLTVYKALEAHK